LEYHGVSLSASYFLVRLFQQYAIDVQRTSQFDGFARFRAVAELEFSDGNEAGIDMRRAGQALGNGEKGKIGTRTGKEHQEFLDAIEIQILSCGNDKSTGRESFDLETETCESKLPNGPAKSQSDEKNSPAKHACGHGMAQFVGHYLKWTPLSRPKNGNPSLLFRPDVLAWITDSRLPLT
jgi:hypothetical protein